MFLAERKAEGLLYSRNIRIGEAACQVDSRRAEKIYGLADEFGHPSDLAMLTRLERPDLPLMGRPLERCPVPSEAG